MLLTVHGLVREERVFLRSFQKLAAVCDWVSAVSRPVLEEVLEVEPALSGRVSLVANGMCRHPGEPPRPGFDPPILLMVGRLSREKGFDVGLQAFARLRRRVPAARLEIAGDGDERQALEQQAADLEVAEAVRFLGWVQPQKVFELYDRASVVLVPSRYEGFGLVALEAAQRARPVVASRVGGLGEVVVDGLTGSLTPPEQPGALARALLALVRDPERAQRMGRAGRARALAEFSLEATVRGYDDLYRHIVGQRAICGEA